MKPANVGTKVTLPTKYVQICIHNSHSQESYFGKSHVDFELGVACKGTVCLETKGMREL